MADYNDNTFNMDYGDWVKRESAIRGVSTEELEQILEIKPIRINVISPWACRVAQARFNSMASKYNVVTDFREGYAPAFHVPFLRFLPVDAYYMSGTGIIVQEGLEIEGIVIDNLDNQNILSVFRSINQTQTSPSAERT